MGAREDFRPETLVELLRLRAEGQSEHRIFTWLSDGEDHEEIFTFDDLDRRARAIATALGTERRGERALLLYHPGLDYIAGFFGCLYAGVVAVPAYPPDIFLERGTTRLRGLVKDAQASIALTAGASSGIRKQLDEHADLSGLSWLETDRVEDAIASDWSDPRVSGEDLAFLQYTSGSTSAPKGVMVTHRNLIQNAALSAERISANAGLDFGVSWLPPYHDMGLIGCIIYPVYGAGAGGGGRTVLMSPLSFLQRPYRWLRAISRYRATLSAGPNFAYELCVRRTSEEERAELDLSRWELALSGAEPVRSDTMERFVEMFAPCGFRRTAFSPGYGLAEATLAVSMSQRDHDPLTRSFDSESLQRGLAVEVGGSGKGARELVACGSAIPGSEIRIVDPESLAERAEGQVGEIWVSGSSVAQGYWGMPETSERIFGANIAGGDEGPYLRTGDLGFLRAGELFITGRLKDLIIVRGRNLYPEDIEHVVAKVHPALRPTGAAFSVEADGSEALAIVQEVEGRDVPVEEIAASIREVVSGHFGVALHWLGLVEAHSLPKTTSGKIQRHACHQGLVDGTLRLVGDWKSGGARAESPDREPAAASGQPTRPEEAQLEARILQEIAAGLGIDPKRIDPEDRFARLGVDSAEAVALSGRISTWLERALPATLLWDHPTPRALAAFLAAGPGGESVAATPVATSKRTGEPIAIIGLGCRLPGANDPSAFWRLLREGQDAVREVPAERWSTEGLSATRGGFLDQVDLFDADFFRISAREAAHMDPQQRLLLEVAWEALEDAGQSTEALEGSRSGVFVGISSFDYLSRVAGRGQVDPYAALGNAHSIAANRISYLLGLRGPSVALDTACSSSLVAIHLACQSLRSGECDLAIAGGVNLLLSPATTEVFGQAGFMAADGRCKTFDARADGYVRGEGAGAVVLKPFELALADGDPIHSVILGSAINNDGASNGLTAPSRQAQEAVIRDACSDAGVDPSELQCVEAHGTGTALGDPIEAAALGAVVGRGRPADRPCLVGSVKTNIGHLESAAGIAGVIKMTLALERGSIPPSLHFETPNPHIAFPELSLEVATALSPWPEAQRPPIAGVSSFGFGGANAHVVLAAKPSEAAREAEARRSSYALPISARSPGALEELAGSYLRLLEQSETDVGDLCSRAATRRSHYELRSLAVGGSREELREALAEQIASGPPGGDEAPTRSPRIAFLFSGQGSQWPGMARELLRDEPEFRAAIEELDALFSSLGFDSVLAELVRDASESRLGATAVAQPTLFAVQVALARLWRSWGIEPVAVGGHSLGELAAAWLSGALELGDAARIVIERARLMQVESGRGRMVAVELSEDAAVRAIHDLRDRIKIAAVNGPVSVVLSGETAALEERVARLEQRGIGCRWLPVDCAFHGPAMARVAAQLRDELGELEPGETSIAFFSTVFGRHCEGNELGTDYWGRNLADPVRLADAVAALADSGVDAILEVGAHPVLSVAVAETLRARGDGHVAVAASLVRNRPERLSLLRSLATLYVRGALPDWRKINGTGRPVPLPTYPWQRRRFWLSDTFLDEESLAPRQGEQATGTGHPLLRRHLHSSGRDENRYWETEIDLDRIGYLRDHQVGGACVVPAMFFVEIARAAGHEAFPSRGFLLEDLAFERVLLASEGERARLQLLMSPIDEERFALRFSARSDSDDSWTLHARGQLRLADWEATQDEIEALDVTRSRCPREVPIDAFYASLADNGLAYGPAFQRVEELQQGEGEAVGRLRATERYGGSDGLHPAHLDAALQVAACAAMGHEGTWVPIGIGRFAALAPAGAETFAHAVVHGEGGSLAADVTLRNPDGEPVALVEGLVLQRLDAEVGAPDWLFGVEWAARERQEPEALDGTGCWLLLADDTGAADEVARELEARGGRCVQATPGERFASLGMDRYAVDPSRPQDLVSLLDECLGAGEIPRGVLHLWSLDIDAGDTTERARSLGCLSAVHLVQALAGAGWRDAPRLWLVTRGAQPLPERDEPVSVLQSPLCGLGRVVALEHPELRCTRVDLDPMEPGGAVGMLDELAGDDGEREVAWRAGVRHVSRLSQLPAPETGGDERTIAAEGRPYRLEIGEPGTLERLALREIGRGAPGPGEIEIEVRAAGLNFKDVLIALGVVPSPVAGVLPLGGECAGVVSACGEGVTEWEVGDRVAAVGAFCFATHTRTRGDFAVRLPESVSFEDAATLPIAFMTAGYALEDLGRLRAGERVLIHSASGGVGLAALQIARHIGAEVYATAGSPEKRDFLREQGVAWVGNSRSLDFADEILEQTQGRGVDVVLNSLSGEAIARNLEVLAPLGRLVEIGIRDILEGGSLALQPFHKGLGYFAFDLSRMMVERPDRAGELLREVVSGLAAGRLSPLPAQTLPISQAETAFRTLAQARHIGKLVLSTEDGDARIAPSLEGGRRLRPDATYLITGGTGGLGLCVARWLAECGAHHLVLASRFGPSPEAEKEIAELRLAGVCVSTPRVDLAREEDLAIALREIEAAHPQIRGVIHAAGTLDDAIVLQQDAEHLQAVMAPKIDGALNLLSLLRDTDLDFFLSFSSVASLLGSPGQANYAAANAFLDALAHEQQRRGVRAQSINWGPWSQVGMAAGRTFPGVGSLSPEAAIEVLERLLGASPAQVGVVPLDARQWFQVLPQTADDPFFERLAQGHGEATKAADAPVRRELMKLSTARARSEALGAHVRTEIARVLGTDPGEVGFRRPLSDMGLDSLMGLELRNRLESSIGVLLSPTLVWSHPTLEALVPELAAMMGLPHDEEPAGDGEAATADHEARRSRLDPLSTAEVARGLAEELRGLESGGA